MGSSHVKLSDTDSAEDFYADRCLHRRAQRHYFQTKQVNELEWRLNHISHTFESNADYSSFFAIIGFAPVVISYARLFSNILKKHYQTK